MRILLSLVTVFYSLTSQAHGLSEPAPTDCPIGAWVVIMNEDNLSSKKDITTALEVLNRARNVLEIYKKTSGDDDQAIIYNLKRNPKNPQNNYGRTLEHRTIHAIYSSFLALKGMNFYCWN